MNPHELIGGQATRVRIDLLVGQMLGEYRVLERINQGGMGVLYRGEHPTTGRPVAIKVLLPEIAADPRLVDRLQGEARAVGSIRHPNIIEVFNLGKLPDGRHYLVMELLEGRTLSELLEERGHLEPAEVERMLAQAMSALQAAHAAGVIHRDLKPENLFIRTRPEGLHLTLLDFGLAKQQGSMSQVTAPNVMLGTPGFMAPEQIRGEVATPAIDIYAMGTVAWVLLTGREPYAGGSIVEVMQRQLDAPVPSVRAVVPGVPLRLDALVARMMAKDPAARPSAQEALGELVEPAPNTLAETPAVGVAPAPIRKLPLIIGAVGLAAFGGAVGLLFFNPAGPPAAAIEQQPTPVSPRIADAIVVVDPPRPHLPSRAEVERSLQSSRAKVPGLSRAPARRSVLVRLARLEDRLKRNEAPAVIARDLEKLIRDYDLK